MKLSEKDLRLVNASIEHWKRDIEAPLLAGEKPGPCATWISGGDMHYFGEDCPLCKEYADEEPYCEGCPIFILLDTCGTPTSPWSEFDTNPCLETCQGMIAALESLKGE